MEKKAIISKKTILDLYYNPSKIRDKFEALNPESKVKAEEFVSHSEAFMKKLPDELKEEYMEIVCQRSLYDQEEFNNQFVHAFYLGLRLAAEAFVKEELE